MARKPSAWRGLVPAVVLSVGLLVPEVALAEEPELSDEEVLRQARPRPAVSIGLRASPLGGNRNNADFTLGGSATFWLVPWIGVDVTVLALPLGGAKAQVVTLA